MTTATELHDSHGVIEQHPDFLVLELIVYGDTLRLQGRIPSNHTILNVIPAWLGAVTAAAADRRIVRGGGA